MITLQKIPTSALKQDCGSIYHTLVIESSLRETYCSSHISDKIQMTVCRESECPTVDAVLSWHA